MVAISERRFQFAINLNRVGTDLFGALILLGALLVQAITFYCIKQLFYIVRNQASAADSLARTEAEAERAST